MKLASCSVGLLITIAADVGFVSLADVGGGRRTAIAAVPKIAETLSSDRLFSGNRGIWERKATR